MLLVAGGQLDPNVGAFLRGCLRRRIDFKDLLVGPGLHPALHLGLDGRLALDGRELFPSACFVRHDVFHAQRTGSPEDARASLNWFHSIRDWAMSCREVRLPNRRANSVDQGKYAVLRMAMRHGLAVPETVVSTDLANAPSPDSIRKPVAGGELTAPVVRDETPLQYPHFLQGRLERPEMRVYLVGHVTIGFELESPDLDYRSRQQVTLRRCEVPIDLRQSLVSLAEELGLDFAAADLMRDCAGGWRFLEINSQPMFAAFDRVAEGALVDALLDWLLDGDGACDPQLRVAPPIGA